MFLLTIKMNFFLYCFCNVNSLPVSYHGYVEGGMAFFSSEELTRLRKGFHLKTWLMF